MSNNTAVWRVLHRLEERFSKLYKRKAHLHHYLEYMQQQEFIDAQSHVKNILNSYRKME
jgi:tubulin epsilon